MTKSILNAVAGNSAGTLLLLVFAAALEVFGDAFFQTALHRSSGFSRVLSSVSGAALLILYGVIVNLAPWDFGKLLGIYMVFFFIVSQLVAWLRFHQAPTASIYIGGSLIVAGGAIICWGKI